MSSANERMILKTTNQEEPILVKTTSINHIDLKPTNETTVRDWEGSFRGRQNSTNEQDKLFQSLSQLSMEGRKANSDGISSSAPSDESGKSVSSKSHSSSRSKSTGSSNHEKNLTKSFVSGMNRRLIPGTESNHRGSRGTDRSTTFTRPQSSRSVNWAPAREHIRRSSYDSSSSKQSDLTDSTLKASNRSEIQISKLFGENGPDLNSEQTKKNSDEIPPTKANPSKRCISNNCPKSLSNLLQATDSEIAVEKVNNDNQSVAGSSNSSGKSILREGKYSTLSIKKKNDASGKDKVTATSLEKTAPPQTNLNRFHTKAKELVEADRFMSDPTMHRRNSSHSKPPNKTRMDSSNLANIDSARRGESDSMDGSNSSRKASASTRSNEFPRRDSYLNDEKRSSTRHFDSLVDSSRGASSLNESRGKRTAKIDDQENAVKGSVHQNNKPYQHKRNTDDDISSSTRILQQEGRRRRRSDPAVSAQNGLAGKRDGVSFDGQNSMPNLESNDILQEHEVREAYRQVLNTEKKQIVHNNDRLSRNYQNHLLQDKNDCHQSISPTDAADKDTNNTVQFSEQEICMKTVYDPCVFAKTGERDDAYCNGHNSMPNLHQLLEDFPKKIELPEAHDEVSNVETLPLAPLLLKSRSFTVQKGIASQSLNSSGPYCTEHLNVHAAETCNVNRQPSNRMENKITFHRQASGHNQYEGNSRPGDGNSVGFQSLQGQRQNFVRNSWPNDGKVESLLNFQAQNQNQQTLHKQRDQLFQRKHQNSDSAPKLTRPVSNTARNSSSLNAVPVSDQYTNSRNHPHPRVRTPTSEDNHVIHHFKQQLPHVVQPTLSYQQESTSPYYEEELKHTHLAENEQHSYYSRHPVQAKSPKITPDSYNLVEHSEQRMQESILQQRQQHYREHQKFQHRVQEQKPASLPVKQKSGLQKFFGGKAKKHKQPIPEPHPEEIKQSLQPTPQEAYQQRLAVAQAAFNSITHKEEIMPAWEVL